MTRPRTPAYFSRASRKRPPIPAALQAGGSDNTHANGAALSNSRQRRHLGQACRYLCYALGPPLLPASRAQGNHLELGYTDEMPLPLRLFATVIIGVLLGLAAYPTIIAVAEAGRRCSTAFDPAAHLGWA